MSSTSTTADLPSNIHISTHPCVRAKLSLLRSASTNARDTAALIHDIALLVGTEALGHELSTARAGTDTSPLGYAYPVDALAPARISIMPIMRSGLAMVDPITTLLPLPVPVHHLGLFRDKATGAAIEYYNNLPYHQPSASDPHNPNRAGGPSELVILVDPVIATGATACAAIDTLRDWGVQRVVMLGVLASLPGLVRAAEQWPEGVSIWVGGADEGTDAGGMIKPGLGDVGDRLFLTMGK